MLPTLLLILIHLLLLKHSPSLPRSTQPFRYDGSCESCKAPQGVAEHKGDAIQSAALAMVQGRNVQQNKKWPGQGSSFLCLAPVCLHSKGRRG